ncbi:MAG: sulfite exporter TauE/SafE family protein [Anaerolineales bacterium]|nr:sulfite exporter TauE/SafE family protein [Anaerolineales bacterium]
MESITERPSVWLFLLFFGIGAYGGFVQAGVGIFLLAGLVLGAGYDLVRANAVKVGIVLLFTISALIVFVSNDQVNWIFGLIMGVGNMAGAWLGTRFAAYGGAEWVRRLLIAVVLLAALSLLGLDQLLLRLF